MVVIEAAKMAAMMWQTRQQRQQRAMLTLTRNQTLEMRKSAVVAALVVAVAAVGATAVKLVGECDDLQAAPRRHPHGRHCRPPPCRNHLGALRRRHLDHLRRQSGSAVAELQAEAEA